MPSAPRPRFEWKLRTRSLALGERTLVMAIINLTPDSFSGDGLAEVEFQEAVHTAISASRGGADIVDLGAESTRPGATPISAEEEQRRLLPVLEAVLRERGKAVVSVDTYHAATAKAALAAGAEIINDVSGLQWDSDMGALLQGEACGYVMMHTRGRSSEWPSLPPFPGDIAGTVHEELAANLKSALALGIDAERIVLDPGFGFGKRGAENFALFPALEQLANLGQPLLAGVSRKRFLSEAAASLSPTGLEHATDLQKIASRINTTTAANVAAILGGAHILRVHNVQAAREAAAIADSVLTAADA